MNEKRVEVEGRLIKLRNLEKEIWPGITKADLVKYYTLIFDRAKSFLQDRPLALVRHPNGIQEPGFFQKEVEIRPEWIKTKRHYSETLKKEMQWIMANNLPTIVWLGELAATEIHMTLAKDFKTPDILAFDLDPEPPAGIKEAGEIALVLKDILNELGMEAFVKLSGKRGLHVLVPVKARDFDETRDFAHGVGRVLERESELVVGDWIPHKERKGKVFIDYLQNGVQKTIALPYSPRAVPDATVSVPISWKEIKGVRPKDFTIRNCQEWLGKRDPWKSFWDESFRIPF